MSTPTRSRRFAALAALVLAAGISMPLVGAPSATAVQDTATSRLAGDNRFGTAAAVATAAYPDGATDVVLATGLEFADALAASGLAGALDAPILLSGSSGIPQPTIDALEDLEPENVFIVGGPDAISASVQSTLAENYTVTRYEGEGRVETAVDVAGAIADTDDGNPLTEGDGIGTTEAGVTAIVVNGFNWPDAVSASQVAYAGRFPILLVGVDGAPAPTLAAIEDLGIEHVVVVGGPAVVSEGVVGAIEEAGATTQRLAGANRFSTSTAVASYAEDTLDFGGDTVYLATGEDDPQAFADALGGGVIAGKNASPLMLVAPNGVPGVVSDFIVARGAAIDVVIALGGPDAIETSTLTAAGEAAKLDSAQAYEVSGESEVNDVSSSPLNNAGQRTYEVSGLPADTDVEIALLDPSVVLAGGDNITAYTLTDGPETSIESINGNPVNAAGSGGESVQETGTSTGDGTLTFAIDATEPDSVIPVVFLDEDDNGELTLAGSSPQEPYGLGGRTSWLPTEAAAGTYNLTVSEINRPENYFLASVGTPSATRAFFYGSPGDSYAFSGLSATQSQFEGMLSVRDELRVIYDPAAPSNFRVDVDDIPDISDATATVVSNGIVRVTWTDSAQTDVVYDVVRLEDSDGTPGEESVASNTNATSVTDDDLADVSVARYEIRPEGGFSGQVDDTNDDGGTDGDLDETDNFTPFRTNGVKPLVEFKLFENGVTVELDTTGAGVQRGDVWLMHFSRSVTTSSPSITLDLDGDGDLTDGTATIGSADASFSVNGSSVRIVFNRSVAGIVYGTTEVSSIQGFTNGGANPNLPGSDNLVINHNGPELMAGSSSCVVGATTCSIAFNEVVTAGSAENLSNYTFSPGMALTSLSGVSLGTDGRTITMTFSGQGLNDAATLDPGNGTSGVNDAEDGQTSNQSPVDLTT